MLFLDQIDKDEIIKYADSLAAAVRIRVEDIGGPQLRTILSTAYITQILSARPENLLTYHRTIMQAQFPGFDELRYREYLKTRRLRNRTIHQENIINEFKPGINVLDNIFNYEALLSKNKERSYNLALLLNRNTCTYCNRLYTNTVIKQGKKSGKVYHVTRPHFDHWFAKSIYPALSLSIHNLIPSCYVCNSTIKGDNEFEYHTHYHPYSPKLDEHESFKFSYVLNPTEGYKVTIKEGSSSQMNKFLEIMKVRDIYNAHAQFELKDLIDLNSKYNKGFLKTLFGKTLEGIYFSEKEVFRLFFGVESEPDNFHSRPFSKFKCDIIKELREKDTSS